jgi:hypothetical protein
MPPLRRDVRESRLAGSRIEPELPRRKRLRLAGSDYSELEADLVTICTRKRQQLLGEIVNG